MTTASTLADLEPLVLALIKAILAAHEAAKTGAITADQALSQIATLHSSLTESYATEAAELAARFAPK